jgi:hypothetical protein
MRRSLFIFLTLLAALLAAFSARARVSPVCLDDGMISQSLESSHAAPAKIGYDDSPAAWTYDVDISIGTTDQGTTPIVAPQANCLCDEVTVSAFRADSSPPGPLSGFGGFFAAKGTGFINPSEVRVIPAASGLERTLLGFCFHGNLCLWR